MLVEDELRGAVLLVLANKQDLPGAMSVAEVCARARVFLPPCVFLPLVSSSLPSISYPSSLLTVYTDTGKTRSPRPSLAQVVHTKHMCNLG